MHPVARLPAAQRYNKSGWLSEQVPELSTIAHTWFNHMRDCGKDVRELIHDGCPVACVKDAPFASIKT